MSLLKIQSHIYLYQFQIGKWIWKILRNKFATIWLLEWLTCNISGILLFSCQSRLAVIKMADSMQQTNLHILHLQQQKNRTRIGISYTWLHFNKILHAFRRVTAENSVVANQVRSVFISAIVLWHWLPTEKSEERIVRCFQDFLLALGISFGREKYSEIVDPCPFDIQHKNYCCKIIYRIFPLFLSLI